MLVKAKMEVIFLISSILSLSWLTLAQYHGEVAHKMCAQYAKYSYHENYLTNQEYGVAKCEDLVMPLIIGGSKADRTEFPHMAAIGYGTFSKLTYLCGGTLISDKFVLSAAHCEKDHSRGRAIAVRLGSISLTTNDDHTHIVPINEILSHPDYKTNSKYNDITLMRLARTVYFNEFIRPACLNVNSHVQWSTAIATGFGLTSTEYSVGSNDLLKVELNQISMEICRRTYKVNRFIQHGLIESQFCAGDLSGNKDTCQGDSGGPLQILVARPHCVYSIIGITSFGKSCGFKNTPAVYTNVSHYIGWIEELVWKK